LSDIAEAVELMRNKPRAEGESAYPEIAAFEEAIRCVIRLRKPRGDDSGAKWIAYMEAYRAEGNSDAPDEETQKLIAKLNEKIRVTR
jgi:hypothetical protein